MLDGDVTDIVEARSLGIRPDYIDVYSASWGPTDDGRTVDGPRELTLQAMADGVNKVDTELRTENCVELLRNTALLFKCIQHQCQFGII